LPGLEVARRLLRAQTDAVLEILNSVRHNGERRLSTTAAVQCVLLATSTSLSEITFHKWISIGYIFVLCKEKPLHVIVEE